MIGFLVSGEDQSPREWFTRPWNRKELNFSAHEVEGIWKWCLSEKIGKREKPRNTAQVLPLEKVREWKVSSGVGCDC